VCGAVLTQRRTDYVGVWCVELQCVAVCCSVLQCAALCCSVLQCVTARLWWCMRRGFCSESRRLACVQCIAVSCIDILTCFCVGIVLSNMAYELAFENF